MQTKCLAVVDSRGQGIEEAKKCFSENMTFIYHLMEKSKNNSMYNYTSKHQINPIPTDFEMQKSRDVRSATTAPVSQMKNNGISKLEEQKTKSFAAQAQSKNDSWENCDHLLGEANMEQEQMQMQQN